MQYESHPSNRLYYGQVGSRLEALELREKALRIEATDQRKIAEEWNKDVPEGEKPMDNKLPEELEAEAEKIASMAARWREVVTVAENALIAEWKTAKDEQVSSVAESLETEDWQSLAV